ncbi:uncharacterized protein J4E78_010444 [Alternaria triticimaculans]|uniref:uncharacterized protein n=1 Tax=Alternaria triticimaculans TaxID=297637 RepID=UPI0020C460D0|nr:uncharacterized protein J4E78_010444 [Alternaria triticimaculans]KAI4641381.1 hypothetical protein J4E78_010444 [Alternaria triticimaculans]
MTSSDTVENKITKKNDPDSWTDLLTLDPESYRLHELTLHPYYDDSKTPADDILQSWGPPEAFSILTLCAAIQKKCSLTAFKAYLQTYAGSPGFRETLTNHGWPLLYYAAERNSVEMISVLQQHGVNTEVPNNTFAIPLLAYVAIHGQAEAIDTSEVMKLVLANGANPTVIPMDMWVKFLETPQDEPVAAISVPKSALQKSAWCTPTLRPVLARALHLTHRYLLSLAYKIAPLHARARQIAKGNKMLELTKLPYFLVGQRCATRLVMKKVYSHIAHRTMKPLIMAFAGASGHGKTELARSMGQLLSVDTVSIDCASCGDVWALFGSTAGWDRNEDGSKLNNFLTDHSGKRSVVFLDEFDKTNQKVRDALLNIMQSGEYENRRSNNGVDCKQTIWIVATNFGDDEINTYYAKHIERLSEKQKHNLDIRPLQVSLAQKYGSKFGMPFTGRLHLFVPFLPFSPSECAVVLHKFMLEYATSIRQPIDHDPSVIRYIGHCRLSLVDDGKICTALTEKYYSKDLGARSLDNAVREVRDELADKYSETDVLATEDLNDGPLQTFIVRRFLIADDVYEVGVFTDGTSGGEETDSEEGANGDDEAKWGDGVAGWNKWDEDGSPSDRDED